VLISPVKRPFLNTASISRREDLCEDVLGGALEEDGEARLSSDVVAAPHHPPHVAVCGSEEGSYLRLTDGCITQI